MSEAQFSATALAAAINKKQISSSELLQIYVDRIEQLDGPINAVVTLDLDQAVNAARKADELTASGADLPPLHGLPITVKDAIAVTGIRSTGGAIELRDYVPDTDAPSVARLRRAGAIVFGKTNLPRWSADSESFNELFGTTNNPWAPDRTPGGSSGGPAAAVACGLTSFELGTDIAGSIRIPSHFSGVFGLKPSYGLISQRGYLSHVTGGTTNAPINVFGPLARSADDLDLLLSVLAGPDPDKELAWSVSLPEPRKKDLSDIKFGMWMDEPSGYPLEPGYRARLTEVIDLLTQAGAHIEAAHPPVHFEEQVALFRELIGPSIRMFRSTEERSALGIPGDWMLANEERVRTCATWAAWFEQYDILLCPVTLTAAYTHNQSVDRMIDINGERLSKANLCGWTGLVGVPGLPSAVPPIGQTSDGLPVGLQVVAPYLRDREAIHAARLIAEVVGGYVAPPGFE